MIKLKWNNQYIKSFNMVDHEFTLGTYEEAYEFNDIEHCIAFENWFGIKCEMVGGLF
jgi:hypothetical protein